MPETVTAVTTMGGKKVSYQVKHSSRARRLRISISTGGVTVTLPKGIKVQEAERFLLRNSGWVLNQLAKANKQAHAGIVLPDDVILLLGEPVHIQVVEEPGRISRSRVDEGKGRLVVRVPEGTHGEPRKLVEPWLKGVARNELARIVHTQSGIMGVSPRSISIRDQRTRWGSCSGLGSLSFSWRLVMAPPQVMEYVVIHELAHIRYPNHSKAFWTEVSRYSPSYKTSRDWLKKNGSLLRRDQ